MSVMASEVYDALVAAGQADSELATKADLQSRLTEFRGEIGEIKANPKVSTATLEAKITSSEAKMWRLAITVASLAVLLNKFLEWVIK